MSQADTSSPFLPLPDGLVNTSISSKESCVMVHVACRLPRACYPLCGQSSERIHGDYTRTVADLPCAGRCVILRFLVRKFVCSAPACTRKIFTERHADLVRYYARMTNRLSESLQTLGFATCGELGERLAPQTGDVGFGSNTPAAYACAGLSPAFVCEHFRHRRLVLEKRGDIRHHSCRFRASQDD